MGTLGVRVEAEERWSVWSPEGNYTETRSVDAGRGGAARVEGEERSLGKGWGRLGAKRGKERRWSWRVSGGWALDVWALAKHVPRVPK